MRKRSSLRIDCDLSGVDWRSVRTEVKLISESECFKVVPFSNSHDKSCNVSDAPALSIWIEGHVHCDGEVWSHKYDNFNEIVRHNCNFQLLP